MANPGPNIVSTAMNLSTVAAGTGRVLLPFYVQLAQIVNTTDLITAFPLTFKGRLIALDFVTQTKVTTGSKAATVTPKLKSGATTTTVTGGVVTLTSVKAFIEGTGWLLLTMINDDTIDALARAMLLFNP